MAELSAEIEALQSRHAERVALEERDELEARRLARRLSVVVHEMGGARMGLGESTGLMPVAGVEAVEAWLERERRPRSYLAEMCKNRAGDSVSTTHMTYVLGRQREVSPRLAAEIARVTGLDVDLLLPLAAAKAVAS